MARAVDIVVVGGGLVGLFAAWNLARMGRRVLVAERDTIACGTTTPIGSRSNALAARASSSLATSHLKA